MGIVLLNKRGKLQTQGRGEGGEIWFFPRQMDRQWHPSGIATFICHHCCGEPEDTWEITNVRNAP